MKKFFITTMYCLAIMASAVAGQKNPQEVLSTAAQAIGGKDQLAAIKTIQSKSTSEYFDPEESFNEGSPSMHIASLQSESKYDVAQDKLWLHQKNKTLYVFPYTYSYQEVILQSRYGYIQGKDAYVSKKENSLSSLRVGIRQKEFLLANPALLIKKGLSDPTFFRAYPDTTVEQKKFNVLGFTLVTEIPVRLFVNAETGLVEKIRTAEDMPAFGDVVYEINFSDWQQTKSGIKHPFSVIYTINGKNIQEEKRSEVNYNDPISRAIFEIPAKYKVESNAEEVKYGHKTSRFFTSWIMLGLSDDYYNAPYQQKVVIEKVKEGVYTVMGGNYHSLLVDQGDYFVLAEAPWSQYRSKAIMAEVNKQWPGKKIKYVICTHWHYDHIGGVRAFAAEGATIVVSAKDVPFVKEIFADSHTLDPDKTPAKNASEIIPVSDAYTITGKINPVQVFTIDQYAHTDDMLIAYVPDSKILFNSDMMNPGYIPTKSFGGVMIRGILSLVLKEGLQGARNGSKALLTNIERRKITPEIIVGGHASGAGKAHLENMHGVKVLAKKGKAYVG